MWEQVSHLIAVIISSSLNHSDSVEVLVLVLILVVDVNVVISVNITKILFVVVIVLVGWVGSSIVRVPSCIVAILLSKVCCNIHVEVNISGHCLRRPISISLIRSSSSSMGTILNIVIDVIVVIITLWVIFVLPVILLIQLTMPLHLLIIFNAL